MKLLRTAFPVFQPGPTPPTPPKWVNAPDNNAYWKAKKALTFNLKKYFYLKYITNYNCKATTNGFYRSLPFDIGDFCKKQITVTTSTLFEVNNVDTPQLNNKPITIFTNMCRSNVDFSIWTASIKQKYRRTNATSSAGTDVVTKKRNCYKDYEWNGTKWVKVSENPDTNFFDYTVTFNSELNLTIFRNSIFEYLNPNNYEVLADFSFGGVYNNLVLKGLSDAGYCPKMSKAGTLVFAGKAVDSDVIGLGAACEGGGGSISMNVTWTPSDKLDLI